MVWLNNDLLFLISSFQEIDPRVCRYSRKKNIIENSMMTFLIKKFKYISYNYVYLNNVSLYFPTDNLSFMIKLVKKNGALIKLSNDCLKKNINLWKCALKNNGDVLRYAPEDIKDNEELVLLSLYNGGKLYHASARLQNERKIVMKAIDLNPQFTSNAIPSNLENDFDFVSSMILKKNKYISLAILSRSNLARTDYELCKICIELSGYQALRLMNPQYRYDPELIKICRKSHYKCVSDGKNIPQII